MRHALSRSAVLFVVASVAACVGEEPPPPGLTVTSPARGLVQEGGPVVVRGTTQPNVDGDPVTRVVVNGVVAQLAGDGSFTATVDVPDGATLLETTATTDYGGKALDARAVQSGHRNPVGTPIDRAVTATLSADAFAALSAAAGPLIKNMDLAGMLSSMQPLVRLGDSTANVAVTVSNVTFGDVAISLVPVDGGLKFSAAIDRIAADAKADYAGTLVPDGSTTIHVTADQVTVGGTLEVTPTGTSGFTTTVGAPQIATQNLELNVTGAGLASQIANLLTSNLGSTIGTIATKAAERGMQPLINDAFGALAGPQHLTVLHRDLTIAASPAAVAFSAAGAQVTMNLQAVLAGSEASPGFIITPNGTPAMDPGAAGIQLGLADDLVNEMVAEVHALGLLNIHLDKDYGLFDAIDLNTSMPPMISADNADGSLRLVLGDMIATVSGKGQPIVKAAVNAQVDVEVLRGSTPQQVAVQFGKVHLFVNFLPDPANPDAGGFDIDSIVGGGIALQLDSLGQFLVNVPVPSVAGLSLDDLEVHADSGYVMMSGDIH